MARGFTVIIARDEDDCFVGTVPQLKGCHTQGKSPDSLMKRMKEAVQSCLDAEGEDGKDEFHFVVVQQIAA
jgi:predicted RNase H-like HicB family nuclease